MPEPQDPKSDREGLIAAIIAFCLFGLFPLYFKLVANVLALEVLAHRILWSALLLAIGLGLSAKLMALRHVFRNPRELGFLSISACLIAGNWVLFIWAVSVDRVLESSLGYYISPLFNVLLGVFFLKEQLNKLQWMAIGLAGLGVGVQIFAVGKLPWIALLLALSFALYGLVRKKVSTPAVEGLFVETVILAPLSLLYLIYIAEAGIITFGTAGLSMSLILAAGGIVTIAPFIFFNIAARKLPLSKMAIVQYITPTGHFLIAIFVFGEPFRFFDGITFALIWAGLLLFTVEGIQRRRSRTVNELV